MSTHHAPTQGSGALFVRPRDITERYRVPESTVRRWIAHGHLEATRVGRSVFVSMESLDRLFGGTR